MGKDEDKPSHSSLQEGKYVGRGSRLPWNPKRGCDGGDLLRLVWVDLTQVTPDLWIGLQLNESRESKNAHVLNHPIISCHGNWTAGFGLINVKLRNLLNYKQTYMI